MTRSISRIAALTLALAACGAGRAGRTWADENWSLMTADLKTEQAVLKAIDASGVHVANPAGGPERVVPMDQFVELSRTLPAVPLAGRFALRLVGGDKIGGEPVGLKGEQLVWKTAAVGETEIPMRLLAGLSKPDVSISDLPRKDDVVTLANGDSVHGTVADVTAAKVTLQTEAGATDLPLDSLVSIAFATAAPGGRDRPGFRVRLDDGSILLCSAVTSDGDNLRLRLPGGKAPRPGATQPGATRPGAVPATGPEKSVEVQHVAGVEQVNGPVSWLSSRAPSQSVYVPFFGSAQEYPARMNANFQGNPIHFRDRVYPRGIGVHSYSKLVFPLDGQTYKAFRTRYALDPSADGGGADVTVRIKVGDKLVHQREHFQAGELSAPVLADIDGAKSLTLEVDFGANGPAKDRLNWIEPALLKAKPAEEPAAPPHGDAGPASKPAAAQASVAPSAPAAPPAPEVAPKP